MIDGIQSMLGAVREVLTDLPFIGRILELVDTLSDAIDASLEGGDVSGTFDFISEGVFSGRGGGGSSGGASGRPRFGAGRGASTGGQQIDGRQITESTGRYRADSGRRRGL